MTMATLPTKEELVQCSCIKIARSIPRRDVVARKGDDDEKALEYLLFGSASRSLVAGRTALKKFETSPVFGRFVDACLCTPIILLACHACTLLHAKSVVPSRWVKPEGRAGRTDTPDFPNPRLSGTNYLYVSSPRPPYTSALRPL